MCGRYTLSGTLTEIAASFTAKLGPTGQDGTPLWDWEPNYNIAPSTVVPIIAWDGLKQRKIVPMRWGLHPHWKKSAPEGRPLFNARVETAAEKPSFRTAFRRRRALIPTTGWYEWEGVETPKTPYFIFENAQKPKGRLEPNASASVKPEIFAFAGLWDQWVVEEGMTLLSCTILTTPATGAVKHLHHRMPVRLPKKNWEVWLNWDKDPSQTLRDLRSGEDLSFYEVSRTVNSGRASGASLITPYANEA